MSDEKIDRLTQLAALRDSGALTEEEFVAEKARVLGGAEHTRSLAAGAPEVERDTPEDRARLLTRQDVEKLLSGSSDHVPKDRASVALTASADSADPIAPPRSSGTSGSGSGRRLGLILGVLAVLALIAAGLAFASSRSGSASDSKKGDRLDATTVEMVTARAGIDARGDEGCGDFQHRLLEEGADVDEMNRITKADYPNCGTIDGAAKQRKFRKQHEEWKGLQVKRREAVDGIVSAVTAKAGSTNAALFCPLMSSVFTDADIEDWEDPFLIEEHDIPCKIAEEDDYSGDNVIDKGQWIPE